MRKFYSNKTTDIYFVSMATVDSNEFHFMQANCCHGDACIIVVKCNRDSLCVANCISFFRFMHIGDYVEHKGKIFSLFPVQVFLKVLWTGINEKMLIREDCYRNFQFAIHMLAINSDICRYYALNS